jgi:hypothetical protein
LGFRLLGHRYRQSALNRFFWLVGKYLSDWPNGADGPCRLDRTAECHFENQDMGLPLHSKSVAYDSKTQSLPLEMETGLPM